MGKTITKVWLDESKEECTMCTLCQTICPEVFQVPEKMTVRKDAKLNMEKEIHHAAESCPVSVIAIEYDKSGKRDNKV
jgi:ferredoxin